jgi:S-adenosylmethionine-diacylgycerolhomoserine-N-methlytransferase
MTDAATSRQARAMDRMYRLTRHVYDPTRRYYLLGRDRLIGDLAPPTSGSVLEIGCGTARNLIAAARIHPEARFFGFDVSEEMLKTARANVARAGLGERIRLAHGDAVDFDAAAAFGLPRFDRVYVSYALSMIPPWRTALAGAIGLVGPGGRLAVVDFGDGGGLPRLVRGLLHRWLALFAVEPRADLADELGRLAASRGLGLTSDAIFGGWAQYHVVADDRPR